MKPGFVFLLCFLSPLASPAAQTVRVTSAPVAVTVYGDRAAVTRTGEVSLSSGQYLLTFPDLPAAMLDQSVRVFGEAAGAKILDVKVQTSFLDTIPEEKLALLQQKMDNLQATMSEINDRLAVLGSERTYILAIKAQPDEGSGKDARSTRTSVDEWQKGLAFIDASLTKILGDERKATKEKSETQAKIDALQRQMNQISPGSRRSRKSVDVIVQVSKEGSVRLSLQYVVFGAGWQPGYELRFDTETHELALAYRATIRQNTGEEWNNIDLTLSTARPDVSGEKPELFPWYLSMREMPHPFQKAAGLQPASRQAVVVEGQEESAMKAVEPQTAQVETRELSALFHVVNKASIPSDNTPQQVPIASETLHSEYFYAAAPKLSPFVYLSAAVKNTTEMQFLEGGANVFSGADFVATTRMTNVAPGDSFRVSLGADPAVKIERKLLNRFTEYTGTFTKNVRVTYEFSYSLENTRKTPETVSVEDNIPVSQNEKIHVEQLDPAEKDLPHDDHGMIVWHVHLNPGEKKSWRLKFAVEYPQGLTISGIE